MENTAIGSGEVLKGGKYEGFERTRTRCLFKNGLNSWTLTKQYKGDQLFIFKKAKKKKQNNHFWINLIE